MCILVGFWLKTPSGMQLIGKAQISVRGLGFTIRKKSDVFNCPSPKTKPLYWYVYIEIEHHVDVLNQNPIVMIARILYTLPVHVKMMEYKKELIGVIKDIVFKHNFYMTWTNSSFADSSFKYIITDTWRI